MDNRLRCPLPFFNDEKEKKRTGRFLQGRCLRLQIRRRIYYGYLKGRIMDFIRHCRRRLSMIENLLRRIFSKKLEYEEQQQQQVLFLFSISGKISGA